MWQKLPPESKNYFIQCLFNDNSNIVQITDLTQLWSKTYSDQEIADILQNLNPLVETTTPMAVKYTKTMLDTSKSPMETTYELKKEGLFFKTITKFQDIPFTLAFDLVLTKPKVFYEEVTAPLLLTIQNLESQKRNLFDLLKKKDAEIAEYKLEGFELTRKSLITSEFHEETFSEIPSVDDIDSSKAFATIAQSNLFTELRSILKLKHQIQEESESSENATGLQPQSEETNIPSEKKVETAVPTLESIDAKKPKLDL